MTERGLILHTKRRWNGAAQVLPILIFLLVLTGLAVPSVLADTLPVPKNKVILSISGAIENSNADGAGHGWMWSGALTSALMDLCKK